MKKTRLVTAAFAAAVTVAAGFAQSEAQFSVLPLQSEITNDNLSAIVENKIRQALTRTSALSDNSANVFAVEPKMEIHEAVETEGLVMEVGRVKAELTLMSVNTIDGNVFHSVTIPLTGSATGGETEALKKMVSSLKPSDPVFVRFVRKSREKIADYYAANCAVILRQAQTLADAGRVQEAITLLGGISPAVSCYDAAAEMTAQLAAIPVAAEEPEEYEEPAPAPNDTVYLEKVVEKTVEVPATPDTVYVERTVPAATPAPAPASAPAGPRMKISHPDDLAFKIISCRGISIGEQVKIMVEITNKAMTYDSYYLYFDKAFSDSGTDFQRNDLSARGQYSPRVNMPRKVPVKIELAIKDVPASVTSLSYLNISFGNYYIEVYDLPITWN